jgi:DNA-binding winged helix-turn-helix (wHTH) protein
MNDYLLINGTVFFCPSKNLLISKEDSKVQCVLNAPVSRCLSMLIERQRSIVDQREMLKFVWGEKCNAVTMNTLYQSISLLRRALKTVGLIDPLIQTISRKGLTLNKEAIVTGPYCLDDFQSKDSTPEPIAEQLRGKRLFTLSNGLIYNVIFGVFMLIFQLSSNNDAIGEKIVKEPDSVISCELCKLHSGLLQNDVNDNGGFVNQP